MSGRFVSLEGGEGVGKSTQLALLAEALRGRGRTVLTTREPGGSPGAEAIRRLLFDGDWGARAEALLFAAARADHVATVIRPALARGDWVLCDRFIDSSRAYQGAGLALGDGAVMALHGIGSDGLLPDRTLVLSLPLPDASDRELARDGGVLDRFGRRGDDYHATLARFFDDLCAAEPDRVRKVDASGTPAEVTARLLAALDGL